MFLVTSKVEAWDEDFPGSRVKWEVGQTREVHDSLVQKFINNPIAWDVSGGESSSPVVASKTTTGRVKVMSGGDEIATSEISPFYCFHGFAGNQVPGDPRFFDISSGNHGVFGGNLSIAAAWANAGYVSTVDPASGATDSVIRIPAVNFDYSGGEKLIVWWLGAATPEGSDVTLMGDGSSTTAGNQGVRIRMNASGKMSLVLYGQGNSGFSGTTSVVPFDGTIHSFAVVFDGAKKKYGFWVDDVIDPAIPNEYAPFNTGTDVDTKTTNTWNVGAASRAPGGTEGSAVKTRALVILRLPQSVDLPMVSELTPMFKALRANPSGRISARAI